MRKRKKLEFTCRNAIAQHTHTHSHSSRVIKPTLAVKLKLVNDTVCRVHSKSFLYPDEIADIIPALRMYPISPGDDGEKKKTLKKKVIKYHIGCVGFMSEQEIKTKYRKYDTITP